MKMLSSQRQREEWKEKNVVKMLSLQQGRHQTSEHLRNGNESPLNPNHRTITNEMMGFYIIP